MRAVVAMAHKYHMWQGSPTEFISELAAFGADAYEQRPEKVTAEIARFREKLHDNEGVLFQRGKRAKGKRYIMVQEVQTDGF